MTESSFGRNRPKFLYAVLASVIAALAMPVAGLADAVPNTVTNVYSESWIYTDKWYDICTLESWDHLYYLEGLTGGGYLGAYKVGVAFDYANGRCTLRENQTQTVSRFDKEGFLDVQFQVQDGTMVKCIRVKFKIEGGRLLAKATNARWAQPATRPYDFDANSSNWGTVAKPGVSGYGIQKLTVHVLDTSRQFTIEGSPEDFGTVTPDYGISFGHSSGDELGPLSAPSKWESADKSQSAKLNGYKIYTQSEYGGEWTLSGSGSANEIASLVFGGVRTRLVWDWKQSITCTLTAGEGGTVSPASQTVDYGDALTATATPLEGYQFSSWQGLADETIVCDNPLSVTVTNTLSLTAVFLPDGSTATWIGGGETELASEAANWKGGSCPLPGQSVDIRGANNMTWDLAYPVKNWFQTNYTGVVTIGTVYNQIYATGPECLFIAGNVYLTSGTWTHKKNGTSRAYRLNAKVGGDMTVGPDAVIHADVCGYQSCIAINGKTPGGNCGGAYGGHGGFLPGQTKVNYTYGSYSEPEDPGNGGSYGSNSRPGAGAIRLEILGSFTHNGTIRANSGSHDYYSGSGGSIYVIAGTIAGKGAMKTNSGSSQKPGGGGRIAVRLTGDGADFSQYDILNQAESKAGQASADSGTSGTIYAETADDVPGEGWLIMKGNGTQPTYCECSYDDPFTYEMTTLSVSKLTMTNAAIVRVPEGCTMDVRKMTIVADALKENGFRLNGGTILYESGETVTNHVDYYMNCITAPTFSGGTIRVSTNGVLYLPSSSTTEFTHDIVLDGGSLFARNTLTLNGDLTAKNGGTLYVQVPMTINGDVRVADGGVIRQRSTVDLPTYRCELTVNGEFAIDEGGKVTAKGCGYRANTQPSGNTFPNSINTGASHGGWGYTASPVGGKCMVTPYGSIWNPDTYGSGSQAGTGGGIVKLTVNGTLTVDGSIDAESGNAYYCGGAGSVNVTAEFLKGTGRIEADGTLYGAPYQNAPGGGGRVLVKLTGTDADFSQFPVDHITAYGQKAPSTYVGGAGTVYLRTPGQAEDEGHLVVRNQSTFIPNGTLVGGDVAGTVFGDVTICDNAKLEIAEKTQIDVKGSWTNGAYVAAGAGSVVNFTGSKSCRIAGNTTFAGFSCTTPGKVISFASGSVQTVSEVLSVSGGSAVGEYVTMTGDGGTWQLNVSGASAVLNGVALGNCQSDSSLTVVNGRNLGGNSANVQFASVVPGETITWTGDEDARWENAGNWDLARAPVSTDVVVVPTASRSPALGVDASVSRLTLAEGMTLALGESTLTVTGEAVILGAVSGSSSAGVELRGNSTVGGTWSLTGGRIAIAGTTAKTIAFSTVSQLPTISVAAGPTAFAGDVSCDELLVVAGANMTFAKDETIAVTKFVVSGTAESPVTLYGEDVWNLAAVDSEVEYAHVTNSDASEGLPIVSETSTGSGVTLNWLFEDNRVTWIGGETGDFGTGGNWTGGSVPSEDDDVVVSGAVTVTLAKTATVRIKSFTLGANAKLVVNGSLSTVGFVAVAGDATLEWNAKGAIGGRLVLLNGSTMTHAAGGSNRIDLDVAGDAVLQAGSKIDIRGKGYKYGESPFGSSGNGGGSHGGRGYMGAANTFASACYGSIVAPTNHGAAGGNSTYSVGRGGGSVSLVIGGKLTFRGEIDADAADNASYYSAAGGSVRLVAATLAGDGSAHAGGGFMSSNDCSGGGGRISVVLTNGSFDDWAGSLHAYGGYLTGSTRGSAGTVYTQAAGEIGKVLIENRSNTNWGNKIDATDFPSTLSCAAGETDGIDVELRTVGTLNVTADTTVNSISLVGTSTRVRLNGHTVKVNAYAKRRERLAIEAKTTFGGTAENPGKYVWRKPGLAVIVK